MKLVSRKGRGPLELCLLLPLLMVGAAQSQTIPVWYSHGNIDQKTIGSRYRQPIRTSDGRGLLLAYKADTISVTTCAQYLEAVRRGYSAANNFENKKEAVFVETCFTLEYAKQARPSKVSYFPGQVLPTNLLDILPPLIQTGETELDEGENWRRQDPGLSLVKFSARMSLWKMPATITLCGQILQAI